MKKSMACAMGCLLALTATVGAQPASMPVTPAPTHVQGDVRVAADGTVTLEGVDGAAEDLVAALRPLLEGLDVTPGHRNGEPVDVRTRFYTSVQASSADVSTWRLGRVTFGPTSPLRAPTYPIEAMRRGESGHVVVKLRVDAAGQAEVLEVVQGARPFKAAVLDAIAEWTFRPLEVEGIATPVEILYATSFRMQGGKRLPPSAPVCVARDPLLPRVRGDGDCLDP